MPSLKIGDRTTTGLAHLFASLSESCISDTLGSARSREPLFLTYGSQLFSEMFLLEMECIGIVLLWTGFYCLSSRDYLFLGRSVIPFSEPGLYFLAS